MKKLLLIGIVSVLLMVSLSFAIEPTTFAWNYYKMDDNLGTNIILDDNGRDNGNTSKTTAYMHTGAAYKGSGAFISDSTFMMEYGTYKAIDTNTNVFGVSLWLNGTNDVGAGSEGTIWSIGASGNDHWVMTYQTGGNLNFTCWDGGSKSCAGTCQPDVMIPHNKWTMLTWLWDYVENRHLVFMNDTLVTNCSFIANGQEGRLRTFANYVGTVANYAFDASIDDMYVINGSTMPTQDDINSLFFYGASAKLDNCTDYDVYTLNVTLRNTSDSSHINGTVNYVFDWTGDAGAENYSSYFGSGKQPFCKSDVYNNITANILFDYTVGGTTYEYSAYQLHLSDTTQKLDLYATTETTQITLDVRDTNDQVVSDAYIQVLKYDTTTASFSTVEVVKTNDEGEALANLVLYTTWYKFIISYEGVAYLTTESTKIFSTTKSFVIDLTGGDWFDEYDIAYNVASTLTFTNSSKRFTFIWSDSTSAMHYGCLKVEQISSIGSTLLNDTCTESAAATLIQDLDINVDGKTYVATGYFKFDNKFPAKTKSVTFPGVSAFYNKPGGMEIGVFVSWFFSTTLMMAGIWHPTIALTLLLVGLFSTYALQLWTIAQPLFIGFMLLGIITLIKMRKQ